MLTPVERTVAPHWPAPQLAAANSAHLEGINPTQARPGRGAQRGEEKQGLLSRRSHRLRMSKRLIRLADIDALVLAGWLQAAYRVLQSLLRDRYPIPRQFVDALLHPLLLRHVELPPHAPAVVLKHKNLVAEFADDGSQHRCFSPLEDVREYPPRIACARDRAANVIHDLATAPKWPTLYHLRSDALHVLYERAERAVREQTLCCLQTYLLHDGALT